MKVNYDTTAIVWEWVRTHAAIFWWMGIGSLLMFFGTLIVIPIIIVKLPTDYFVNDRIRPNAGGRMSFPQMLYFVIKNLAGVVFVLAGIAMLFLPGQGILTIIIGLSLISLPNKKGTLMWLVRRERVLHSINAFRAKFGKPPLQVD